MYQIIYLNICLQMLYLRYTCMLINATFEVHIFLMIMDFFFFYMPEFFLVFCRIQSFFFLKSGPPPLEIKWDAPNNIYAWIILLHDVYLYIYICTWMVCITWYIYIYVCTWMVVLYDCTCMVVVLRGLTIHVHQKIVYVSFISSAPKCNDVAELLNIE